MIHHIGLRVADVDAAARFYAEAFGFTSEAAGGPEGVRIIVAEHAGARLELFELPGVATPVWDDPLAALRAGIGHFALPVEDLADVFARAVAAGARPVWPPEPDRTMAFLADPDGNLIELLAPQT